MATVLITKIITKLCSAAAIALVVTSSVSLAACDRVAMATGRDGAERSLEASTTVIFSGRVVGVVDGDTLTLLDDSNQQLRIRLAEIDAPESGQPWGGRAKHTLSELVFGKTVSVQQSDTDRYGRVVGRVFAEGRDINRSMVEGGAAWAYRRYLTDQTLIAAEARARGQRLGLWSMGDTQAVPPWEWRRGRRDAKSAVVEPVSPSQPQSLFLLRSRAGGRHDGQFTCSGKRYCRQMTSCEEAHFYLRSCGISSLDGNGDGKACETLCRTALVR